TLAKKAEVSLETVKRLENLDGPLMGARVGTVEAIRVCLEAAGVEFIPANGGGPGVRLRT
ncbi:MAG TPA: transcriptional regulator, partial [Thalassobaculum sp.]